MKPKDKKSIVLSLFDSTSMIRPRDLKKLGISGEYLYKLYAEGLLDRPARGIYTLRGAPFDEKMSLVQIAKKVPNGVICLLSALQFHSLTTQLPFEVWLMIEGKARKPIVEYPPVRICRSSGEVLEYGIEEHLIHGVPIRIYGVAKTVADCFKYRNKVGLDVALEALKDCLNTKSSTPSEIFSAAKVCRVANVIRPYLEAMV